MGSPLEPYETLKGRYVQFRVDDIYLPDPVMVLKQLHGNDVLGGKVIDLCQGGADEGVFVVIEVTGLRQPCILAAERIVRAV